MRIKILVQMIFLSFFYTASMFSQWNEVLKKSNLFISLEANYSTIIAATSSSVFKSTNDGVDWVRADTLNNATIYSTSLNSNYFTICTYDNGMVVYKVSDTDIWSKLYSGYYPVYEIVSNNSFNLIRYYNWLGVGSIGSNIWSNVTKYDKPVENGCVGPHCIRTTTNATLYSVYKNYFYAQLYADRIQHGEVISRVNHGLQKSSDGLNWVEIGITTKLIDFKDDTIFAITDSGLCKTDINGNRTELLNKSDVFNNEVFFLKVFAENENINGINCIVITKMGLFVSKDYGRSFYTSNINVSLFKYIYNYGYYFNRPHYSVSKNSLFAISDSFLYKLKLNDILSTDTLITDVNNIPYSDIKIYPNPTNGIVFIETPDRYNPYSCELYNSYGMLIEKLTNKNLVNLENSPPGLYFIKLITPNRKIIAQKIFKK